MGNPANVVRAADRRQVADVDEDGNGYFAGDLVVDGSLTATGGINADISLATLDVAGDGNIGGNLIIGGDLTVGGNVVITGSLTVAGQPITPGGGGGSGNALEPNSGRFSVGPGWGRANGGNLAFGAGDMSGAMFEVARDAVAARFYVDVAIIGGAGGLLLGNLYEVVSDTDTRPGALVASYGTIPSDDGTGAHFWVANQALVTGQKYVFAAAAQVAGCSLQTVETFDPRVTLAGTSGWDGTTASGGYYKAGVTGAAPDPWGVPLDEVPIKFAILWA